MADQMNPEKITLVGAGLAGSLLAIFLARRGIQVDIFERRPDMRRHRIPAGRSINLALSTRGLHALKQVDLRDDLLKLAIPMRGRLIHSIEGGLRFQPYGKHESEVIYSISRGELNKRLMGAAEESGVRIFFNERCVGVDLATAAVKLHNEVTAEERTLSAARVIGADGSGSAVRASLQRMVRLNVSQDYLEHGYKELTIPSGPDGEFRLEKNALHIWPRRSFMLIALPNLDGSFTATLFLPFEGEYSFATLSTEEKVLQFFEEQFPDAVPLMPCLLEEFFSHPTGSLVTVRCRPWHVADRILLLGDAAHAIVPFFGQGMNCAFEDCTYLDECIETYRPDWQRVFREFEARRKENTEAIADMALANFIEMRDRVADERFLLRKRVELELEKRFPGIYVSRYSLVTFHRIPYAVARRKGEIQEKILQRLCESARDLDDIDWQKAEQLIREELTEA